MTVIVRLPASVYEWPPAHFAADTVPVEVVPSPQSIEQVWVSLPPSSDRSAVTETVAPTWCGESAAGLVMSTAGSALLTVQSRYR